METQWTDAEKIIAKTAFDRAYKREIQTLIEDIRSKSQNLQQIDDLWYLHDLLSAKRHEIDGKYDYRYSSLIFVFAQLLKEGWINLQELEGLNQDKVAKISSLSRM